METGLSRLPFKLPAKQRYYHRQNPLIGSRVELVTCDLFKQGISCLKIRNELLHRHQFVVSYDRVLEYKERFYDQQRSEVIHAMEAAQSHININIQINTMFHTNVLSRTEQLNAPINLLSRLIEQIDPLLTNKSGNLNHKIINSFVNLIEARSKLHRELYEYKMDKHKLNHLKESMIESITKLVVEIIMPSVPRDQANETYARFHKAVWCKKSLSGLVVLA